MKYIVDLDSLKECLNLIYKPMIIEGYELVKLTDVKDLIDAFPKEEADNYYKKENSIYEKKNNNCN